MFVAVPQHSNVSLTPLSDAIVGCKSWKCAKIWGEGFTTKEWQNKPIQTTFGMLSWSATRGGYSSPINSITEHIQQQCVVNSADLIQWIVARFPRWPEQMSRRRLVCMSQTRERWLTRWVSRAPYSAACPPAVFETSTSCRRWTRMTESCCRQRLTIMAITSSRLSWPTTIQFSRSERPPLSC